MDNYNYYPGTTGGNSVTSMVNSAMRQVYLKMTVGLLITAFISLFCSASREYMTFFVTNRWFMWVLIIAEFGLVLGIGAGIRKLSSTTATLLFYLFSVVNGLYLAPIFLVYSAASLTKTFFITAGTFGAMTIFGYTTIHHHNVNAYLLGQNPPLFQNLPIVPAQTVDALDIEQVVFFQLPQQFLAC